MIDLQVIKSAQLTARKNKDAVTAKHLTTVIGEAEMKGKNAGNRAPTSDEVLEVIKKFIKGVDETMAIVSDEAKKQDLFVERNLYMSFLPQQLTEQQLTTIIDAKLAELENNSRKQQGVIMKALNSEYAGQFDNKIVASILKEKLQ